MCHPVIIEYVKGRALRRRDFFRGSAAAGAVIAASSAIAPRPLLAQGASRVVDMTHTLTHDFPTYFGEQQFFDEDVFTYAEHSFNLKSLRVNEHTGTHIDAPLHFTDGGTSIDEVPVDSLVCPLAIVDIREKADADPDAQVTPDDLNAWINAHGPLPQGACVAQNSGWQSKMGTAGFRNADDQGMMHFPGFHVEAVTMLLEEANVAGVAVDTLSIDYGPSADFITHYTWLPAKRWAVENMANLDQLPATGATLIGRRTQTPGWDWRALPFDCAGVALPWQTRLLGGVYSDHRESTAHDGYEAALAMECVRNRGRDKRWGAFCSRGR